VSREQFNLLAPRAWVGSHIDGGFGIRLKKACVIGSNRGRWIIEIALVEGMGVDEWKRKKSKRHFEVLIYSLLVTQGVH
jgi:hypothetical protein